jgi:peptidoglycan/xylan/chitin deacetylase (PgdA/CDA1 family)
MGRPGAESDARPAVALTFDDGNVGNFQVLLPLVERLELPVTIFIATEHIETQRPYWFDRVVNALQVREPVTLDLREHGLGTYAVSPAHGAKNWNRIQSLLSDIKHLSPDHAIAIADRVESATAAVRDATCGSILPLTLDQVAALGRCPFVTIGAHTHGHPLLTQVSIEEARKSIEKSRDLLRSWTGQPIQYFAYPSGAHDAGVVQLIEDLGFRAAFTTQERFWDVSESPFRIPRMGVGRYDTLDQFKLNLIGGARSLPGELKRRLRRQAGASSAYA